MTDAEWIDGRAHALAVFYNGEGIPEPDRRGRKVHDDSFLLLVNPTPQAVVFTIPPTNYAPAWAVALDTATPRLRHPNQTPYCTDDELAAAPPRPPLLHAHQSVTVPEHCQRLLIAVR